MAEAPQRPARPSRSESREVLELRALAERQPELADAVAMHLEIVELYRRIQGRVPLPWFELGAQSMSEHNAQGRPVLHFEQIPIELTDLRLMVRQTTDLLRRHGALDDADYDRVQAIGRDTSILTVVGHWFQQVSQRHAVAGIGHEPSAAPMDAALDQVLTLAMRPFLSRCAEVLQQRQELALWTHPHCPLCGSEPDLAVITPAAERHLICARCTLRWKFEPLTCPYCRNSDKARITSFATPDGQYRVYACDVCQRYLKAYDGRRASRPVMPVVDGVATLPLDAAAIQRGYS
ncbi:MAG: formate dehydrogenase accessory protein FdhE [Vicinamibacterales bacterium]